MIFLLDGAVKAVDSIDRKKAGTTTPPTSGSSTSTSTSTTSTTTAAPKTGNTSVAAKLATSFSRNIDKIERSDLATTVRARAADVVAKFTGPDKPVKPVKPVKPPVDPKVKDPAATDGASNNELRTDPLKGRRSERVTELKEKRARIEADEAAIEQEIAAIASDIKGKESLADTVSTVGDIFTGGLTAIGKMVFDVDPIEAVTNLVLGTEDRKKDLVLEKAELTKTRISLSAEIQQIENEITLNAITSSMNAIGAEESDVDVMDGVTRRVRVVQPGSEAAKGMDSDAAFDFETDTTLVSQAYLESLQPDIQALQAAGLMDAEGNVIDAVELDLNVNADHLLAAGALIAVHEETHADQSHAGESDANREVMQENSDAAILPAPLRLMVGEDMQNEAIKQADLENEIYQVVREELDSYADQTETYAAWGIERTVNRVDLTFDTEGNRLPPAVAAARIFNFRHTGDPGDLKLQMAGHAGHVKVVDGAPDDNSAGGDESADGRRVGPGGEVAGGRRVGPGGEVAGGRRVGPGGEVAGGRRVGPGDSPASGRRVGPGEAPAAGRRVGPGDDISTGVDQASSGSVASTDGTAPEAVAGVDILSDEILTTDIDTTTDVMITLIAPEALDAFYASMGWELDAEGRRVGPGGEVAGGRRVGPGGEVAGGRRVGPGDDIYGTDPDAPQVAVVGASTGAGASFAAAVASAIAAAGTSGGASGGGF